MKKLKSLIADFHPFRKFTLTEQVIILTEAGNGFGYGHLMRCLAIAQGFKLKGIDSVFYLRGEPDAGVTLKDYSYFLIDWLAEPVDIKNKIVIVDSYHADEIFCTNILNNAETVLFIDDYNRIHYPGGFVLNSVIGANDIDYPVNKNVGYLLGPEYHPLRKEFWNVPSKEIRKTVKKILVTFGGTDITNETPGVLRLLHAKYPDVEKHIIIGSGFLNIDEIKTASDEMTLLIFRPDAEKMKQEMLECDIAISAAGQTIYELARVGVTTFAKKVVENQDKIINNWKANNFLMELDSFDKIPDYDYRQKVYKTGRSIIDGKGVHRIVEKLIND